MISSPPASRRQPSAGRVFPPQLRERWYAIAEEAYRRTGLPHDRGPFALAQALGIESEEAVDRRRVSSPNRIVYPVGLPRFERSVFFYRALAIILLGSANEEASDAAISVVFSALILPPSHGDDLEFDELAAINPHVHPDVLVEIYSSRYGSGLIHVTC